MLTEAQKRARRNYQAKLKKYNLTFYPSEQELVDHLEKQEQKITYIKNLIRADLEKQKEKE